MNINHLGAGTIKILLFHTLFIMKKTEKLGLPPTGKIGVFRRWLELKINKFASGAFSLTFNNGAHSFCDTMTELRTILLKNGMTRKWAANVKDRFDPLTEEHVLINRYRTSVSDPRRRSSSLAESRS